MDDTDLESFDFGFGEQEDEDAFLILCDYESESTPDEFDNFYGYPANEDAYSSIQSWERELEKGPPEWEDEDTIA